MKRFFSIFFIIWLVACSAKSEQLDLMDNYRPKKHGHHRSQKAKNRFKLSHPCPATGLEYGACPGYIIDHVIALDCGGIDDPSNMQWQTISEAKSKDKWERKACQF